MSKKNSFKPGYRQRIATPIPRQDGKGNVTLMCPFCNPTHPLSPNGMSGCGTELQVRATQTVFRAVSDKKMICIKCQKGGGEMVAFNESMVHVHNCTPGVATFVDPPRMSVFAAALFRLPVRIRSVFEKYTGEIKPISEVKPDGTRTGRTLGYVFYRSKNAKHTPTVT